MQFSIQVRDITPDYPVYQAGFGSCEHKSTGVLDPLFMKTVLLQANKAVLLVTIDALGSDRSFIVGIKDALQERFGLTHDEVLINFSHTHHAVALTGLDTTLRRADYSIIQADWHLDRSTIDFTADEALFVRLRDTLLEMVEENYATLEEGSLSIGSGESDFAISRRRVRPDGGIDWAPTDDAEIDKELFVLKIADANADLKGILYIYGCHTTGMGTRYLISNDFAGYTSAALEAKHPGATAVFVQACAGELKPRGGVVGDQFVSCSPEKIKELGEGLADEIAAIMETASFAPVECHFRTALSNADLPTVKEAPGFYDAVMAEIPGTYEHHAAHHTDRLTKAGLAREVRPCYVALWQLDEQTEIIAIEGEVSTEYSLMIKRLFGTGRTIVLGYTNGVMSYIPTRQMLVHGGYEAECNYFFELRGPFAPEIEDVLIGRVAKMLHEVRSGVLAADSESLAVSSVV